MTLLLSSLLIGVGATLAFDIWGCLLAKAKGRASPSWNLQGRWYVHMAHGCFRHDDIAAAPPIPHEAAIGWTAHYLIGVTYAAALVVWRGPEWLQAPTPGPALFVGVVTILAGWFLMSPGMGNGYAAARTENPWKARGLGLAAHVVFGLGLWASALALNAFM